MKNVLMIVPFFPPNAGGGAYRPLGFVKYLGRSGWNPTVVTMASNSFWITDDSLVAEIPADCDVRRTPTMSAQALLSKFRGKPEASTGQGNRQVRSSRIFKILRTLGSATLVPDTYRGWYPFAVREGLRACREKPVDAIYSTSPPETSHLIGLRLHQETGLPWVADFRDPWMNLYLLPSPTPVHKRLHERLERRVCEKAYIVVTSPWHREVLAEKYPRLGEVALIPNGYDPSDIEPVMDIRPPSDEFRIVHAGMLTQSRSAAAFLKALKIFFDESAGARERTQVVFLGPRESENDRAREELGLGDSVSFRDTVSHAEALKIERASHILVLIKHANPIYDGIVPGKLYEYIGVRRPILALAPDGEASAIVRRHRRGEVARQDDPRAIADRLKLMADKHRNGTLETDYDLSPVAEYRRDVLTERLAERLDSLSRLRV
jgi:glycosyltransferase involved in cell wall biosynthesis